MAEYLRKSGLTTELWETPVHPVIFAHHGQASNRPTVLFYYHYDVQPVDPLELWTTPPFEPTVRDGNVYARGASDDKGQGFYTAAALRAFLHRCPNPPFNIKVFVEGEEECGSAGPLAILKDKQKELKADYLFVVDGGLPAPGIPAISLGLRGLVALEVVCRNSSTDLHSGIHGGMALNPNRILIQLLSLLWDAEGRVAVPGFYNDVDLPSKAELEQFFKPDKEKDLREKFGLKVLKGEPGFSLWESNTIRPTLEINGIGGGYTGPGFKTVIPAVARAKISCRLVPRQEPQNIAQKIIAFLKHHAPPGADLEITTDHGGRPIREKTLSRAAQIASAAYEEVFGRPCEKMLGSASIPLIPDLTAASGAEMTIIGVGLATDNIHAPNEKFGLDRLEQGFLLISTILEGLQ
jgi:acetylornithine deacetylase/succinyl-diaminopimelate desuccinylase-like protein